MRIVQKNANAFQDSLTVEISPEAIEAVTTHVSRTHGRRAIKHANNDNSDHAGAGGHDEQDSVGGCQARCAHSTWTLLGLPFLVTTHHAQSDSAEHASGRHASDDSSDHAGAASLYTGRQSP